MNMILTVNWGAIWAMTGIGLAIVFAILLLLVYVLQIFSRVASKKAAAAPAPAPKAAAASAHHESDEEIAAAIAASLYLFTEEAHDVESDVITIVHNDHSSWHHFN